MGAVTDERGRGTVYVSQKDLLPKVLVIPSGYTGMSVNSPVYRTYIESGNVRHTDGTFNERTYSPLCKHLLEKNPLLPSFYSFVSCLRPSTSRVLV